VLSNKYVKLCIVFIIGGSVGYLFRTERVVKEIVEVKSEAEVKEIQELKAKVATLENIKVNRFIHIKEDKEGNKDTKIKENIDTIASSDSEVISDIFKDSKDKTDTFSNYTEHTNPRKFSIGGGYTVRRNIYFQGQYPLFGPLLINSHISFLRYTDFGIGLSFNL
jgi:hypothetical protein